MVAMSIKSRDVFQSSYLLLPIATAPSHALGTGQLRRLGL